MPIISIENVNKKYRQGQKIINASQNINLKVEQGEFIVVIGPSGSGKSTLLQLLGGLDRPDSGSIKLDGTEISKISEAKMTSLRRKLIGFIFQNFNLIPTLTAEQNVEIAINHRSQKNAMKAKEMLRVVGLTERANHLPSLLSGGEQQRVAIARALVNDPKIILADEPTGNLDSKTGEEIMMMLKNLNKKSGKTIILITHSEYVKKFADQVLEIRDGMLNRI